MNKENAKDQLLRLYESQIVDLTMMSKIELGDDVIKEIHRLKGVINAQEVEYDGIVETEKRALLKDPEYSSFTENLNVSLLNDAYRVYLKDLLRDNVSKDDPNYILLSKQEFINRCETDAEFAKQWSFERNTQK
jgi:hypothetical protein